jgi:hypothetical protein
LDVGVADLEMGKILTVGNTLEVVRNAGGCTYVQGEIKERIGVE